MSNFNIVGGVVYLDKQLYNESCRVDNDLSKLIGSTNLNMFRKRPRISTGIESVTIDYTYSDSLQIQGDPDLFVNGIKSQYKSSVRGQLIMEFGEKGRRSIIINNY